MSGHNHKHESKLRSLSGGEEYRVEVERLGAGFRVRGESPAFEAEVSGGPSGPWSIVSERGSREAVVEYEDGEILVTIEGEQFRFADAAADDGRGPAGASARAEVKAPMPGKVVKLLVSAGDAVTAGQGVLLFEAMKMQNEIRSPQDGTIGELFVAEGEAVEARDRLFVVLGSD